MEPVEMDVGVQRLSLILLREEQTLVKEKLVEKMKTE